MSPSTAQSPNELIFNPDTIEKNDPNADLVNLKNEQTNNGVSAGRSPGNLTMFKN